MLATDSLESNSARKDLEVLKIKIKKKLKNPKCSDLH